MPAGDLVAVSQITRELVAACRAAAAGRSKVLLTGETGVGKEVFAHFIHDHSARRHAPMITINCAGVPETLLESELFGHVRGSFTDAHRDRRGLLEVAHGTTVLLDEIGEMSLRMQALLLRFLETGEIRRVGSDELQRQVDVRLLAATNRDLLEETKKGTIREDLYYRLNVMHLVVPPLRDRTEDIKPLLDRYLQLASHDEGRPLPALTAEALAYLEAYRWPGNVRELRNVAERLMVGYSGRLVGIADLPPELLEGEPVAARIPTDLWQTLAADCYDRMVNGRESFWTAVYEPFIQRDLTRDVVRSTLRRGLEQTRGSYTLVAELFNLPSKEYRRFTRFLHQHRCHIPVQSFRLLPTALPRESAPSGGGNSFDASVSAVSSAPLLPGSPAPSSTVAPW